MSELTCCLCSFPVFEDPALHNVDFPQKLLHLSKAVLATQSGEVGECHGRMLLLARTERSHSRVHRLSSQGYVRGYRSGCLGWRRRERGKGRNARRVGVTFQVDRKEVGRGHSGTDPVGQ